MAVIAKKYGAVLVCFRRGRIVRKELVENNLNDRNKMVDWWRPFGYSPITLFET